MIRLLIVIGCLLLPTCVSGVDHAVYRWLSPADSSDILSERFPTPAGYQRPEAGDGSYASWLRGLPLKSGRPPVELFDGRIKLRNDVHCAVANIDTGERDLQQCADAAIRLRAEYLFSQWEFDAIGFIFTSGDTARYSDWRNGSRPRVAGNKVTWIDQARPDSSYQSFREYLDTVFMYAGSYSLARDLKVIDNPELVRPGDLFILPGFPGHVVLVADMAINQITQERVMLLAQGYTPAQDFHLLKNLIDPDLSPWYEVRSSGLLVTPEWTFDWSEVKRFPEGR